MEEVIECGSSEEVSSAQKVYDIGVVMTEKSNSVSDHKKYLMFKNHFRLGERYEFKKALKHGCYRSCKRKIIRMLRL